MYIEFFFLIFGIGLIYYGGELFVRGSVALAEILDWSKLIIGVVVLGFGTSAPEIAISIASAVSGHAGIVVGNILGSNVANVLLILGLSLAIKPSQLKFQIAYIYPLAIIISALLFLYGMYINFFSRWLGIVMLLLTIIISFVMVQVERERKKRAETTINPQHNVITTILKIIIGLILLIVSSLLIISSVTVISRSLGISETVIAASIVAVGTSLPELVLSIIAAKENHFDLVLGNIIGSNISNILLGIGMSASIVPLKISNQISTLDIISFIFSTVLLIILNYATVLRNRSVGFLAVAFYLVFIITLYV